MQQWNRLLEQWKKAYIQNLPPFVVDHRNLALDVADWRTHLNIALESSGVRAKHALRQVLSRFPRFSEAGSSRNPSWASVSMKNENSLELAQRRTGPAMAIGDVEERLARVPVYALINSDEDFVLVSGAKTGKSLGLFCFREEDEECLLEQLKSMDPGMRQGSKVVPVALHKFVYTGVEIPPNVDGVIQGLGI